MNKTFGFIEQRWVLFVVLIVFVAFKIPHLFYPYYWDESWVYAPAIRQMYHHGVSLMPQAIDAELSRGHPLFFLALAATWMNIFGDSHVAMHSLPLLISVLFLVAVFEAGLRLFNRNVAIIGLLLIATQVIFFVQSSFVLFEVLIAFLAFLSLAFYVSRQYIYAAISLTALFYTKESGLILCAVLGIDAIAGVFNRNTTGKQKIYTLLMVGIPVILIGIFFVIQKHVRGWYVFPLHSGLIEHNWGNFWYKFRIGCIRLVFYENLKFYTYLLLMAATVIATVKSRKYRLLVLMLPATIIFYYVDDMRAGRILPGIPFFILFIASVAWFLFNYGSKSFFPKDAQGKFIILTGSFVFCFLCFSALNFFTYRYLLAALIPMLFLAAVLFDLMISYSFKWLFFIVTGGILVIGFFSFKQNNDFGDSDLGAFRAMEVQQNIVDYLEHIYAYDSVISTSSFLESQHLVKPETGFLHSSKIFTKAIYDITPKTNFVVFDNIEPDSRYAAIKADTNFTLVYKVEIKNVWGEIYKRK